MRVASMRDALGGEVAGDARHRVVVALVLEPQRRQVLRIGLGGVAREPELPGRP